MSETSITSPVSPVQHRDFRSSSKPSKRDKEHNQKWSHGQRPLHGVKISFANWTEEANNNCEVLVGGNDDVHRAKVRPVSSPYRQPKLPTGNSAVSHYYNGHSVGRVFRKVDALEDAREHTDAGISRSLIDLLPSHANNTATAVQTLNRSVDDGILYSFDNKGASPGAKGRAVGLDALVEQAEKKFLAEQTERIVKGEYEVLDGQGEVAVLSTKKGKRSPKQRAVKTEASVVASKLDDDDGFELI